MLTSFELSADLPLVIDAENSTLVPAEGRLGSGPHQHQVSKGCRCAGGDAGAGVSVAGNRPTAAARVVVFV